MLEFYRGGISEMLALGLSLISCELRACWEAIATSNKKLLVIEGIATSGARTLLVAPGITTSSKKLLVTRVVKLDKPSVQSVTNLIDRCPAWL